MADLETPAAGEELVDDPEARLARAVRRGLPLATIVGFCAATFASGLPAGFLVLVAGGLLGTIALLWASLRLVTGDAPIAPELEALDTGAHAVDQLASRKTMLLRAIKDLENEHALGKLEDEDYALVRETYREDLREVLRSMDDALAPYRGKAEALARAHLEKVGLAAMGDGAPPTGAPPAETQASPAETQASPAEGEPPAAAEDTPARRACPACEVSNEPDARFCKGCGGPLGVEGAS